MTNPHTLDEIMLLDPLNLTSEHIDFLIAKYREQRQDYEGGKRPKKDTGPKAKIDLAALGLAPKPTPANTIRRRV